MLESKKIKVFLITSFFVIVINFGGFFLKIPENTINKTCEWLSYLAIAYLSSQGIADGLSKKYSNGQK